ncbi:MAG: response regulator transcription factor [Caldilineales bacterium]|nr:response regulator transcription factor [Caldilineales bacterium]MDW8317347.1 response regulator transcription factor [Anaerolineae bacterium]
MRPIRVVLVDDHPVVRQGVRSLLANHPDIQVIGEADSAAALLALLAERQPDVVLLDVRLPGKNGIDLAHQLKREWPAIKIIVLTTYEDDEYLFGALRAGAEGYLLKSASPEMLAGAIRQVAAGERLLSPSLVGRLMQEFSAMAKAQARAEAGLSDQELEVLRLIAAGATNREIADRLYWSEITVKRKVQDILTKMGVANRSQAVAEAVKRGLI